MYYEVVLYIYLWSDFEILSLWGKFSFQYNVLHRKFQYRLYKHRQISTLSEHNLKKIVVWENVKNEEYFLYIRFQFNKKTLYFIYYWSM